MDKAVSSLSVVNSITSHDLQSMLCTSYSSSTSYDYIGEEKRKMIAEEVSRVNPFSRNREQITFYDKSSGSPFSGMTCEKIDKFLKRNCTNFKRRFKKL